MNIKDIRQLAGWIRDAGLTALEVKRPGFELFIRRSPDRVYFTAEVAPVAPIAITAAPGSPGTANSHAVKAANPGLFFSMHPDERNSYVKPGDLVVAGQLLALLRVGRLYLPVRSNQAGRVVQILVAEGERVGYGQALIEIEE